MLENKNITQQYERYDKSTLSQICLWCVSDKSLHVLVLSHFEMVALPF